MLKAPRSLNLLGKSRRAEREGLWRETSLRGQRRSGFAPRSWRWCYRLRPIPGADSELSILPGSSPCDNAAFESLDRRCFAERDVAFMQTVGKNSKMIIPISE